MDHQISSDRRFDDEITKSYQFIKNTHKEIRFVGPLFFKPIKSNFKALFKDNCQFKFKHFSRSVGTMMMKQHDQSHGVKLLKQSCCPTAIESLNYIIFCPFRATWNWKSCCPQAISCCLVQSVLLTMWLLSLESATIGTPWRIEVISSQRLTTNAQVIQWKPTHLLLFICTFPAIISMLLFGGVDIHCMYCSWSVSNQACPSFCFNVAIFKSLWHPTDHTYDICKWWQFCHFIKTASFINCIRLCSEQTSLAFLVEAIRNYNITMLIM